MVVNKNNRIRTFEELDMHALVQNISDNTDKMTQEKPRKNQAASYEVTAISLTSDYEKDAVLRELAYNQQNLISDYKTWAKEEVHYDKLENPESVQKLKECNDSYTLSMWMSCLAPLRKDLSFTSLMGTWVSFKAMDWFNPTFQEDSARMMANLRNNLSPQISAFCDKHPSVKKSVEAFDELLADESSKAMNSEIAKNIKVNNLDSMVMTPRQIAALKLNFSEQYYVDMRQYDPTKEGDLAKLNQLSSDYEKAMQHLSIISNNGGFDMSVVAAEERFLVGLKIKENPAYANIFDETHDVYGARPEAEGKGEYITWSGDFYTADGHKYTTGGNQYGAFTVRQIANPNVKAQELKRRAEQYASMIHYLDSDECPLDKNTRKFVKSEIKDSMNEYKDATFNALSDDGVSKSTIKNLWENQFSSTYTDSIKGYEAGVQLTNASFQDELNHIVDKHCVTSLGIKYVDDIQGNSIERSDMLSRLRNEAKNRYGKEVRDGETILKEMRLNYIESMNPEEVSRLLLHAATNMEQGMTSHGSYARKGKDVSDKTMDEYCVKSSISDVEQGTAHMKSEREIIELPDDDTDEKDDKSDDLSL